MAIESTDLAAIGREHLWLHFARMGNFARSAMPVITRGEGIYLHDSRGRRIFDGLSGLFVVQVGHGRHELADVVAKQAAEPAHFPIWGYATEPTILLAERLAQHTPGDINRVFFTSGGSEAVESAWKVTEQYFKLIGKPLQHKVISRAAAYRGTPHGALSITGLPPMKQPFEPLVPGTSRVPNTNFSRAAEHGFTAGDDLVGFGQWAADRIEEAILFEGPDTVAAVFLERAQNSGGCRTPPPGYFQRVREICDKYRELLASDEVICGFDRHGTVFACEKFGYTPDVITCAKGMTSGRGPLGAMLTTDRIMEPFLAEGVSFAHGYTFGGHPVSAAVALANLDLMAGEQLYRNVLDNEAAFRKTLQQLLDLPIVGDVRGYGYFWAIELVGDKATKQTFDAAEREFLIRTHLPGALLDNGRYCRPDDRGDPVIQLAPPLTCGPDEFAHMEQILRRTLIAADRAVPDAG